MPGFRIRNYLCVLLAVLAASTAAAAEQAEEAIAGCARIASVGDRILCLENALRNSADASVHIVKAEAATPPEVGEEALNAVPDEQAPIPDANAMVPVAASAAAATTGEAAAPAAVSQPPGLGAEQLRGREGATDDDAGRTDATIIAHKLVLSGRLRLTLDNGQVWQQTTDDDRNIARFLIGEKRVAVEMWRSRSGGYRMYLVPFNRTLKVRRLK